MSYSLTEINDALARSTEEVREAQTLTSKLDSIQKDLRRLRRQEKKLRRQLEAEIEDVEKLRGMSFKNLIATVSGRKKHWEQKEWQEYLDADFKHEHCLKALEDAQYQISRIQQQLDELGGWEQRHNDLQSQKEQYLLEANDETAKELLQINQEIAECRAENKELNEAIRAGNDAMSALQLMERDLGSASGWGVWDMVGGGMISSMIKHSSIDKARDKARRAQKALDRLKTELADVGGRMNGAIEIGEMMSVVDMFFDNIFVDWMVQSRIGDAKRRCDRTMKEVRKVVGECMNRNSKVAERDAELQRRYQEILNRA